MIAEAVGWGETKNIARYRAGHVIEDVGVKKPCWDELKKRNVAAANLNLSGTMRVVGPTDTGRVDDEFLFRYGHGGKWWIQRFDEVVFVSSTSAEDVSVARMTGGHLVYQRASNSIVIGRVLGPKNLFGPQSMVTKRNLRGISKPIELDLDGRLSWSVMTATPKGTVSELVFDDHTGVIVRLASDHHDVTMVVKALAQCGELPASQFRWDGPVVEPEDRISFSMKW